uniref:WIYLD domain-containing protein n=1 Tax=Rhizophora mucronata TaxID=61149 RepID=A0A2P2P4W8_RHIMU
MAPRPRGRSRKKLPTGQRRVDAALDAMRSYGFPDRLIASKINELLDVYGQDGWPFIEDSSYRVLLDAILESDEKDAEIKDDSFQGGGRDGNNSNESAAGSSRAFTAHTYSIVEATTTVSQAHEALVLGSPAKNVQGTPQLTYASDCNACQLLVVSRGEALDSGQEDINLDQHLRKKPKSNVQVMDDRNTDVERISGRRCSSLHAINSLELVDVLPSQRPSRRPCHGWIGSDDDDEEEEDLVKLTPASLPEESTKLLLGTDVPRNRKKRWDVGPADMKVG